MSAAILQDWLDRFNSVYFDRDFPAHRAMIDLPITITTREAVMVVRTEAELRTGFDVWADMLVKQGATDVICTATATIALHEDLLSGHYETRILRGTVPVCAPYAGAIKLRRSPDGWRAISLDTGMKNITWPIDLPRIGDTDGRLQDWTGAPSWREDPND